MKHLYKYFSNSERNRNMLRNGALYFAPPSSLNDLFELKIDLDVNIKNIEELFNCTKMLLKDTSFINNVKREMGDDLFNMLDKGGLNFFKQNVSIEYTIKSLAVEVNKIWQFDLEELGICCFATNPTNKLMWAHYTNDNSGFCLEFENKSWLSRCKTVKYFDEYPKINIIDIFNKPELYLDLIYSKSSEWKYEDEFRAVKEGKGELNYPKEILSSVIFGFKMLNKEKNEIVEIFDKNLNIEFKEIVIEKGQFDLKLKPFNRIEET